MAKSTALARPIVIAMPRRGRARRAARAIRHYGGRAVRRVGRAGARHLPATGIAIAAAAVGWAESKGYLDKLPTIGGSRAFTIALAGYAATRWSRNAHVRMAGMAAIAAGAFDWGKVQGGGTSGLDEASGGGDY
jgi:hypothetical protein